MNFDFFLERIDPGTTWTLDLFLREVLRRLIYPESFEERSGLSQSAILDFYSLVENCDSIESFAHEGPFLNLLLQQLHVLGAQICLIATRHSLRPLPG